MKKTSRKLNLNRETLIPLTEDALGGIHGGMTPTITTSTGHCSMTGPSIPQSRGFTGCNPLQTRLLCQQTK